MCAFFVNFFNKKIKIKKTPVFGGGCGFGRILICLIQTVVCFWHPFPYILPQKSGNCQSEIAPNPKDRFPKTVQRTRERISDETCIYQTVWMYFVRHWIKYVV